MRILGDVYKRQIISNIQEDDLAVTQCTLRKIRQLMEEIDVYKRQEQDYLNSIKLLEQKTDGKK